MLELKNMSARYPDGRLGLKDFSFVFEEGVSYALLGANGAGKSTLMKALLGLVDAEGFARVCGVELRPKNLSRIRALAGLVFQNSDDQLFCASIADDIAFGLVNLGLDAEQVKRRALEYSELLGVGHLLERGAQRLSEGEKKRAAICAVLAMEPKLLLLDEPTSQLDPRGSAELARLLSSLKRTMIVATHDLNLAKKTCPVSIILKDGSLAASGKTGEILEDAALLEECGLI